MHRVFFYRFYHYYVLHSFIYDIAQLDVQNKEIMCKNNPIVVLPDLQDKLPAKNVPPGHRDCRQLRKFNQQNDKKILLHSQFKLLSKHIAKYLLALHLSF